MKKWVATPPDYGSDYKHAKMNGVLECLYEVPPIQCCAGYFRTRYLNVDLPDGFRNDLRLQKWKALPIHEHKKLREDLAQALGFVGNPIIELGPGTEFRPTSFKPPAVLGIDFIWPTTCELVVSSRILDGLLGFCAGDFSYFTLGQGDFHAIYTNIDCEFLPNGLLPQRSCVVCGRTYYPRLKIKDRSFSSLLYPEGVSLSSRIMVEPLKDFLVSLKPSNVEFKPIESEWTGPCPEGWDVQALLEKRLWNNPPDGTRRQGAVADDKSTGIPGEPRPPFPSEFRTYVSPDDDREVTVEVFGIPKNQKAAYLAAHAPTKSKSPLTLKTELWDPFVEKNFLMQDYLLVRMDEANYIVSPYFFDGGSTAMDWYNLEDDDEEGGDYDGIPGPKPGQLP